MKRLVFVLPGLVAGFLLGRAGPAAEQAELEQQLVVAQERAQAAERSAQPRSFFPGAGELLRGVRSESDPLESKPTEPELGEAQGSAQREQGLDGPGQDGPMAELPQDMEEQYELAVEAQGLRIAQNRAALEEQADLSPDQVAELDQAMDQMNAELALLGEDLLVLAMSDEPPQAIEMLAVSHDVTGILYEAQLALEDTVGADTLLEVDMEASQVWNYIDLEVFRETVQDYGL